jgi:hypothetical protein
MVARTGLPPDCYRQDSNRPRAFLFRFAPSEGGFDYLGRSLVGVGEQIPLDAEGDRRRAMAKPPADGEHVHPPMRRTGLALVCRRACRLTRGSFSFASAADHSLVTAFRAARRAVPILELQRVGGRFPEPL